MQWDKKQLGPSTPFAEEIHKTKYRLEGETFLEQTARLANALKDDQDHFLRLKQIFREQRFLPGGRIQSAIGSPRNVTAFNCFVSGTIEDSMDSIMHRVTEAAETMRRGGGIGYDFSNIRPYRDRIVSLDSLASGPVSFMAIYEATCQTIASAGHRRGAQMGVLRVDHPDIEYFIRCKQNENNLRGFNISVGITAEFMEHLKSGEPFPLRFEGRVYKYINPKNFWDELMRLTWDWAEPGVLFIDTINKMNNLYYCETITTTNPCGEQPLPAYGACLLGSFNLTKYIKPYFYGGEIDHYNFNWDLFAEDIKDVVRAMDNVIDNTTYPLLAQEKEAKAKRRMGLGITGTANAGEILGYKYASDEYIIFQNNVLAILRDVAYETSTDMARTKGVFPEYDKEKYLESEFIKSLPSYIRNSISTFGIRNSHLLSIAPTGTISITANNVSSGIEPPFSLSYERTVQSIDGPRVEKVKDYASENYGTNGVTANELPASDHVKVLCAAQKYIDSAVSKTCNVGDDVTFDEFKDLYIQAYEGGAKGCTTFRASGKRFGILNVVEKEKSNAEACFIDPATGNKECG